MNPTDVSEETVAKFGHIIDDDKAGFCVKLIFVLTAHGPIASINYGSHVGGTKNKVQGDTTLDTLRALLEEVRKAGKDDEEVHLGVIQQTHNPEERTVQEESGHVVIPIAGVINFRPFLLKWLPTIIRVGEMLEAENTPSVNTGAKAAQC